MVNLDLAGNRLLSKTSRPSIRKYGFCICRYLSYALLLGGFSEALLSLVKGMAQQASKHGAKHYSRLLRQLLQ